MLTPAGVSTGTLRRWTVSARRRLRVLGRITITIVTPTMSKKLNRQYRHRDRPTNVLSFDYAHDRQSGKDRPVDGEILLCTFVIRREAKEQGRAYQEYLKFLLEHGLIHLLGLDHQTAKEQRTWEKFEHRLA